MTIKAKTLSNFVLPGSRETIPLLFSIACSPDPAILELGSGHRLVQQDSVEGNLWKKSIVTCRMGQMLGCFTVGINY